MTSQLVHRGPDGGDHWIDPTGGIALGHRRLAIVDLSPAGRQPMISPSGRWVVTYNGEVYGFRKLRSTLEALGHTFRGGSDTEVVLAAVEQWGPAEAVARFDGMFAIALWDRELRQLHLMRDRIGKKPLYYGRAGDAFVFASELKAIRVLPQLEATIDVSALQSYLRFNAVVGRRCIYHGLSRLPPATHASCAAPDAPPKLERYWSLADVARRGLDTPITSAREALEELEPLLKDAVARRLESDVPLGAFLSGGIDSSLVVALMREAAAGRVRTYAIGFEEGGFDEARHAAAVAAHLGTEHTELYVTSAQCLDVVPRLPEIFDEPFCDRSQIPTHLVAAMARSHVTVALTGDGGDEVFLGYPRYAQLDAAWRRLQRVPAFVRSQVSDLLAKLGVPSWLESTSVAGRFNRDRARFAARLLRFEAAEPFYREAISVWREDAEGRPLPLAPLPFANPYQALPEIASFVDLNAYLPDDVLVKVDRASMAASLEPRAPLLDHRVIELALRLPPSVRARDGIGKWPLKQLLYRRVPRAIVDRPKRGFGAPIAAWLRGPLQAWASDLLAPGRLRARGYLDEAAVQRLWRQHRRGLRDASAQLWAVLMLESWLDSEKEWRARR